MEIIGKFERKSYEISFATIESEIVINNDTLLHGKYND